MRVDKIVDWLKAEESKNRKTKIEEARDKLTASWDDAFKTFYYAKTSNEEEFLNKLSKYFSKNYK